MKRRSFLGAIGALFCGAGVAKAAKPECGIPPVGSRFPVSPYEPIDCTMYGYTPHHGDVVMIEYVNGEWIVVARSA